MTALLSTHGLIARYGDFQALFGIDTDIAAGEILALIGANGAGKTTLLRAVCGLLPVAREQIRYEGVAIGGMAAHRLVRQGIAMVPEGRKLFASLSVEENLRLGGYGARRGPWSIERIFGLFPILREKRAAPATSLSGGQQQMVAIGRALMANPRLLLCDEISLGLAPVVIRDVYAALPAIRAEGAGIVVVEQDLTQVLRVADRLVCLRQGAVAWRGAAADADRAAIHAAYFGI